MTIQAGISIPKEALQVRQARNAEEPSFIQLFVIDLSSEKVIATYPIPEALGEIAIDNSGEHAYISCPQKGTIEVLDIRERKMELPIVLTPGVDGLEWLPAIS